MRRIHVQNISVISIAVTIILSIACVAIFTQGRVQFETLQQATETYISCEKDAKQLQSGSDYLTEQVRMVVMAGDDQYIDNYFTEADETQRREQALEDLKGRFSGTDAFNSLQQAMNESTELMQTEYYAMRLTCDANGKSDAAAKHPQLQAVEVSDADNALTYAEKVNKAQNLVSNSKYQAAKNVISSQTDQCVTEIIDATRTNQGQASAVFSDIYRKLEICVAAFAVLTLAMCVLIRRTIVRPLMDFSTSIKSGTLFPVKGAGELQILAETYNRVYEENEATQMLIKHRAEHDALTDLLNRGSYDKLLNLYVGTGADFALILVDVDTFKSVNDTFGHAEGDRILKRVATLLKTTFRSIDHICRIGGDEFAVIMVDMTSDLRYTIEEKTSAINEQLARPEDGMPKVSLSVGVAFADRPNPGESLFKDADQALYYTKEHGRNGCTFYGDKGTGAGADTQG